MESSLRIPPHSTPAEQAVLGAIFLRNDSLDKLDGYIGEADFYQYNHQLIYRAMLTLHADMTPIDLITVQDFLESRKQLEQVGGLAYLGTIAHDTPSASTVMAYAEIVRDTARARRLIVVGTEMADAAYETADVASAIEDAQSAVMSLTDSSVFDTATMRDHLRSFVDELDRRSNSTGGLIGLRTGFADLDKLTSGLRGGDLVIIGARPSMGKTAFALNIIQQTIHDNKCALMFSAEMSGQQIIERLASSISGVHFGAIREGKLSSEEWPKLSQAIRTITASRFLVDDRSAPSVARIKSTCRKTKREQGLDLLVVDYLQLLPGEGDNRTQQVGSISRGLKEAAKEFDIPVILISQLNRSLESRNNKRPVMSDLRDSGEIEQDADIIAFLYRDEVYNPDSNRKGCAELIIAKHRNGSLGTIGLATKLEIMRFEDLFGGLPDLGATAAVTTVSFRGSRNRDRAAGE